MKNLKSTLIAAMIVATLSIPAALSAQTSQPTPAPKPSAQPMLLLEMSDAGAGTPTVIEIPKALLSGQTGAPVAGFMDDTGGGNAAKLSLLAGVALSMVLIFGGLRLLRPGRLSRARAAVMIGLGLIVLAGGAIYADVAPPPVRHAPTVGGPVTLKIVDSGTTIHVVVSKQLLSTLYAKQAQN